MTLQFIYTVQQQGGSSTEKFSSREDAIAYFQRRLLEWQCDVLVRAYKNFIRWLRIADAGYAVEFSYGDTFRLVCISNSEVWCHE